MSGQYMIEFRSGHVKSALVRSGQVQIISIQDKIKSRKVMLESCQGQAVSDPDKVLSCQVSSRQSRSGHVSSDHGQV